MEKASLRQRYGVNIIAISQNGRLTTDVRPDYVLKQEDSLVVIGDRQKIRQLADDLVGEDV